MSLAAAGAFSAIAVGVFGAPLLLGAAIGVGASIGISAITDINIGDKSISGHIKGTVQSGIDTVAGWFGK